MLSDDVTLRIVIAMQHRLRAGHGNKLTDLLRGIAPASDQMLLKSVDDASANQVEALLMVADAVEFQQRTLKTLAFEMLTPAAAVPLVGAMCIITARIVAGIAADSPPEIWTGFNGLVSKLATTINTYAVPFGIAFVLFVVALVFLMPKWIGPLRQRVESWIVFSLYRDFNAAVVLSALAMMLRSGKSMREALEALRAGARPWLRWHLAMILRSLIDNPTNYIGAFGRGLMPLTVRARLASLMTSSQSFDAALATLGSSEISSLEQRVAMSAKSLNWAVTGTLVVLGVVLSIGTMTISTALQEESSPARMMAKLQQRQ